MGYNDGMQYEEECEIGNEYAQENEESGSAEEDIVAQFRRSKEKEKKKKDKTKKSKKKKTKKKKKHKKVRDDEAELPTFYEKVENNVTILEQEKYQKKLDPAHIKKQKMKKQEENLSRFGFEIRAKYRYRLD